MLIKAPQLKRNDRIRLPFGKVAQVITEPKVGTKFVSYSTTYGKTRIGIYDEVDIELRPVCMIPACGCDGEVHP